MKYLAIILSLVLIVSVGSAQVNYEISGVQSHTTGTSYNLFKYAANQACTTNAVYPSGWSYVGLRAHTRDSISFYVYYHPSNDGTNFGTRVLIDSMSWAGTDNGQTFALPDAAMGLKAVKFSWIVNSFSEGKGTDTLELSIYKRE